MISLYDYILESLQINEAKLKDKEWHYLHKNDNHFYPRNVINTLITTGEILLGSNAENSVKSSKLSVEAIEQLKKIDITKNNALTSFNNIVKEFGFSWTSIFKGAYSGTTNGGSGEILVCYLYNHPDAKDEELFEIARLEHIDNNLIKSWVNSTRNTVTLLKNKWNNSNYYAIQIDKNDIKYYTSDMNKNKTMLSSICDLYSNKNFIAKCGVLNAKELYSKSKDEWQKSDILLVKRGINYYEKITTEIEKNIANNIETYNAFLKTLAIDNEILPISLKKTPDGSANIYSHNLNEDKIIQILDDIKVDLKLPQAKKLPEGLGGSTYLIYNNKKTKLQFFKRATGNTFIVELILENSKGGRGLQQILNHLSITNSDFNKTELSKDEVVNGLKEYFAITENDIKDIIEASDIWYKKLCFNKLIVLLNKYYDKFGNGCKKSEIVTPFFIFSYECCEGKSTGSYYIIK